MRRITIFTFLLLALITLEGCASSEPDSPSLFVGMSRERLKARFGEPIHVERAPTGGEDWYYSFASWRNSDVETSSSIDAESRSSSMSVTVSGNNTQEQPVHVSPDGCVTAPLPAGKIVPR
jgi:outer membrane protein assembly factor BamE (lipoprotein component of BamABCDE complex)